jgi:hypothetical protein
MQWNKFFVLKYSKCEQVNKKRWRLEINNFSFKWFNANLRHYLDWNYLAGHRQWPCKPYFKELLKMFEMFERCLNETWTTLWDVIGLSVVAHELVRGCRDRTSDRSSPEKKHRSGWESNSSKKLNIF